MERNPFTQREAIKDKRYFYGRQEELYQIFQMLDAAQSCSIVGERKSGKSSLLYYIRNPEVLEEYGLPADQYFFVYFDFQLAAAVTKTKFWQLVLTDLAKQLPDEKLVAAITQTSERNEITFAEIRELIQEMSRGRRVVLLLDEFEYAARSEEFDVDFFSGLRSLSNSFNIAYVTASQENLLALHRGKEIAGSPFFNIFTEIKLGLLQKSEALELIGQIKSPVTPSLTDETDFILKKAGLHPYLIQIICYNLFNFKVENEKLEVDDYNEIALKSYEEAYSFFEYAWDHLSNRGRDTLLKMAVGPDSMGKLDKRVLRELERKGYIVIEDDKPQFFSELFLIFIQDMVQREEIEAKERVKEEAPVLRETAPPEEIAAEPAPAKARMSRQQAAMLAITLLAVLAGGVTILAALAGSTEGFVAAGVLGTILLIALLGWLVKGKETA